MSSGEREEKLKFEEALGKIEKIVAGLESGNLSLEESLAQFQEGVNLVKVCHQNLEQVEQKIEMLVNSAGEGVKVTEVKITEEGVCL